MQTKSIDEQLAPSSFDSIYTLLIDESNAIIESNNINVSSIRFILNSIDTFMLLCYKWIYDRRIYRQDREIAKEARKELRILRDDLFSMLKKETTEGATNSEFRLPKTTSEEVAIRAERIGYRNALIGFKRIEHQPDPFENVRLYALLARANSEDPISNFRLPKTTSEEVAIRAERIGYRNALTKER